jgi:hypothetical protein
MRRWLLALAVVAALALVGLGAACSVHERGFLSPQFTQDGAAAVVIVRDTRAFVLGLGYELLTPPAHTRVLRDRFSIARIRLADGRVETMLALPPSPLEGGWVESYRPSLTGSVSAHLRWATPDALEYEVAVSRPRQPTSETFVTRRRWNAEARRFDETPWTAGHASMGGDEPTQLRGAREVVALRSGSALPCAVLVVTQGESQATPLLEDRACRRAHPDGYPVTALVDVIRRQDIERVEHLNRTHDRLVTEARGQGMSEGDAAMAAIRGMQRLGLYPKPSTIVATRAAEPEAGLPVFDIAPMEFTVGLFPDIERAIARPGEEVEKSGTYIIHDEYDTSRHLNDFLADRRNATFYVRSGGALWKMEVTRR